MKVENFIGGEEKKSLSGNFKSKSPFLDHEIELPNSSLVEIKLAISSAKKALEHTQNLGFDEREDILNEASRKLKFNDYEVQHISKMTGMPTKHVLERLKFAKYMLKEIPIITEARYGRYFNTITKPISDLSRKVVGYEAHRPSDELISAFIPPNDPAESVFVLAHTVMHGGSLLLKPSSIEPYMSVKISKLLSDCGYPKGGLNVLHWNTSDLSRKKLADEIASATGHRIFFGNFETVQNLFTAQNLIRGKNCFFTAGNSKSLVDSSADLEHAAECIVHSAYGWTIDCISNKAVFVDSKETREEVGGIILEKIKKLKVGDPLHKTTDIGYVENAPEISKTLEGGADFKYGRKMHGSVAGKYQISPYLFETDNINFPALHQEYPYTLTIVESKDFDDSISSINSLAKEDPNGNFMAVSVFFDKNPKKHLHDGNSDVISKIMRLRSHMVSVNKSSLDLNPYLRHQDEFMTERLTKLLNINT